MTKRLSESITYIEILRVLPDIYDWAFAEKVMNGLFHFLMKRLLQLLITSWIGLKKLPYLHLIYYTCKQLIIFFRRTEKPVQKQPKEKFQWILRKHYRKTSIKESVKIVKQRTSLGGYFGGPFSYFLSNFYNCLHKFI